MLPFGALPAGTHPRPAGPRVIPESLGGSYNPPKATIPRIKAEGRWVQSGRHVQEWIRACKGDRPACSRFEIAGPLTEMALLGNVAIGVGPEGDRVYLLDITRSQIAVLANGKQAEGEAEAEPDAEEAPSGDTP